MFIVGAVALGPKPRGGDMRTLATNHMLLLPKLPKRNSTGSYSDRVRPASAYPPASTGDSFFIRHGFPEQGMKNFSAIGSLRELQRGFVLLR